jgi:hypothetical protein
MYGGANGSCFFSEAFFASKCTVGSLGFFCSAGHSLISNYVLWDQAEGYPILQRMPVNALRTEFRTNLYTSVFTVLVDIGIKEE